MYAVLWTRITDTVCNMESPPIPFLCMAVSTGLTPSTSLTERRRSIYRSKFLVNRCSFRKFSSVNTWESSCNVPGRYES
ncbi:hypothetical protein VYU27_009564 [Nannochloropsis oceanica]